MEAKDTIMSQWTMNEAVLRHLDVPMGAAIALEQAEISFKAGIKEAVEWIRNKMFLVSELLYQDEYGQLPEAAPNKDDVYGYWLFQVTPEGWQSKLKEWGIE